MAHSALKSSVPAANATVTSPERLELTFSERVNPRFSKVTLKGPEGTPVEAGKLAVSDDGQTLIVPLASPLPAGKYGLKWNALSGDDHKVSGEYTFTVK